MREHILVTGAAGFIGFHLSQKFLDQGYEVTGVDNLNPYYDVSLKTARLAMLKRHADFRFQETDIADRKAVEELFSAGKFPYVVNLAAQAGVRYSLVNPHVYLESNIHGFLNILEGCRNHPVKHLVYASSSSVYGANVKMPFSVGDNVDHPISLYAATKKSNELMAHTYSALYNIPTTGLRFFTVYGPYGRPDMALFLFTKAILEGRPINVYNNGNMKRDFTYIDDIVESISRLLTKSPEPNTDWDRHSPDPGTSFAPYQLFNIGSSQPVDLVKFINVIEMKTGKRANMNLMPMQPGDVAETFADVSALEKVIHFSPSTPLSVGVGKFIDWYVNFYEIDLKK